MHTLHMVCLYLRNRSLSAGLTQMHLKLLIPDMQSILPERPEWSYASARADHDDGSAWIIWQVEGMCWPDHRRNHTTNLHSIQPRGTYPIM